jgi:hypothetical protein
MFLNLAPVVGVNYFPPQGTYVFRLFLFGQCACGQGNTSRKTSWAFLAEKKYQDFFSEKTTHVLK